MIGSRFIDAVPRSALYYILAPLVLLLIPVVLWSSISAEQASSATPLWLSVPDPVAFDTDPVYVVSLGAIGLLAIAMLTFEASRAAFSLHLAHWIFVYVFLFATPIVQYKIGVFPWGRLTSLETNTLLLANTAILLWSLTWIICRFVQIPLLDRIRIPTGPQVSTGGVWISLALAVLATAYLLAHFGIGSLLTRADDYEASLGISSVGLVTERIFRSLPIAAVAGALVLLRRGSVPLATRLLILAISMALMLIADFPLGTARYIVGAIFIGIFLNLCGRYLRTGWTLVFLLVGGLLLVFPLLSTLRYITSPGDVLTYLGGFSFLGPSLATGDFDAYSMVGYTAHYVDQGPGITYGRQLAGAILFFVPRSLWPDKPVGSGYTVAVEGNLDFNNVSSSPLAEGLINFGWLGLVVFAVALCWMFGTADASFQRQIKEGGTSFVGAIYPFWIGLVFFLMRGDLLSATAFIVAFSVSFVPLLVPLPSLRVLRRGRLVVSEQAGRMRRENH